MDKISINITPLPWYARLHRWLFKSFWTRVIMIPSSWEDVTPRQLLAAAGLITADKSPANDVRILQAITDLPKMMLTMIPGEMILDMCKLIQWMYATPREIPIFNHFHHKGIDYYLPVARMQNSSAVEYAMADQFLQDFGKGKTEAINKLVATLCRPAQKGMDKQSPDWNGDTREKYHEVIMTERAKVITDLPLEVKIAILQFFIGCKKHITEKYALVFDNPDVGSGGGANFGLFGIFFDLADKGTFGNFEAAAHTNIHTIMVYLVKQKMESIQREMSKNHVH